MELAQALYPEVSTERFAENVSAHMRAKHISAAQLQKMIPVGTVQTVYKWLYGKSIPEYATLCALAKIFDVHVEDLLAPRFHPEHEQPGLYEADRVVHAVVACQIKHFAVRYIQQFSKVVSYCSLIWKK